MRFVTLGCTPIFLDDFRSYLQRQGHVVALTQDRFETVDDVPCCDLDPAGVAAANWLEAQWIGYCQWRATPPWREVAAADAEVEA